MARVLASAGGWAFTIALALYAYYEDGVTGIGLAVAVRTLPAAFAAPYVRRLVDRVPRRSAFAVTAVLRGLVLAAVATCVVADFPFWVFLVLVAAYRVAGAAEPSSRGVEEVGFLAGALAAGVAASVWSLDAVFAMCAGVLGLAAVVALVWPVPSGVSAARRPLSEALREADARRLHLLRGGRAAARSVVELLLVIAAIDLLGMGFAGVGWLSAAWAAGLLAAVALLERVARVDARLAIGGGVALVGLPLVFLSMSPSPGIALALLAVVGVGFGLALHVERAIERRVGHDTELDGQQLIEAIGRTVGVTVAAGLVVALGDIAALAVAGVAAALLGAVTIGISALRSSAWGSSYRRSATTSGRAG